MFSAQKKKSKFQNTIIASHKKDQTCLVSWPQTPIPSSVHHLAFSKMEAAIEPNASSA